MKKILNFYKIIYRFLLVFLSSIFVFAGVDKILMEKEMVRTFELLGLPNQLMVVIGFTEIILAIMLQSKYFSKIASHGLMTIMSFAALFNLLSYQYYVALTPISIIFVLIVTNNLGQRIRNIS